MLDRGADKAAIENVGAADGLSFGLQARVGLHAAGNPVIACAPAVGVGMDGDIVAAGVEAHRAVEAVVHGRCAALEPRAETILHQLLGNAIVGGVHHAADRL